VTISGGAVAVGVAIAIGSIVLLAFSYRKQVLSTAAAFASYTLLGGVELGLGLRPYHIVVAALGSVGVAKLSRGGHVTNVFLQYAPMHLFLIAMAIFGWFRAYDPAYGFALVKTYGAGLLLVIVSMVQLDRIEKIVTALRVLTYIGCAAVGLGLIQAVFGASKSMAYLFKGDSWFAVHGWAPVGYSNSPFLFGHDVVVALVPAFVLWWTRGDGKTTNHWYPSGLVLIWLLIGLLISANRSSWVAFILGVGYAAMIRKGPTRRGLTVALVAAGLAVGSPLGDIVIVELETLLSIERLVEDTRVWERVELMLSGIDMWMEAPALGHGAGAFTAVVQLASFIGRVPDAAVYPHNIFLGLAVDYGLIGMGAFVLVIIVVFLRLSGVRRQAGETTVAASALGIQAMLIAYVIDSSFHNYFIDLHLWTVIGVGLALCAIHRGRKVPLRRRAIARRGSVAGGHHFTAPGT
jgi:O-antigen ligase